MNKENILKCLWMWQVEGNYFRSRKFKLPCDVIEMALNLKCHIWQGWILILHLLIVPVYEMQGCFFSDKECQWFLQLNRFGFAFIKYNKTLSKNTKKAVFFFVFFFLNNCANNFAFLVLQSYYLS